MSRIRAARAETPPRKRPGIVGRAASAVVAAALVGMLFTACSRSDPATSSQADSAEIAAIAAAATGYFHDGIGAGDWGLASRLSTGTLRTGADWLVRQGIATSEEARGSFVIHSLAIASVSVSSAVVSLDATQTGANYAVSYTGSVSMVKASDGWKVADYQRDGRSAANAIFPSAHGTATRSGLTVNVVGAQLEAGHVDVWVRISNDTASSLSWNQPIVIVDSSGEQRGRGFLFVSSTDTGEPFVMLPHLSAFGDFLIDSVTLPLTTASFRLQVGATDRTPPTRVDLGVPVALR